MTKKRTLTEHEKNFIRNNYHKLTEQDMANILGVGRFAIQQFKREEGLTKYNCITRTNIFLKNKTDEIF